MSIAAGVTSNGGSTVSVMAPAYKTAPTVSGCWCREACLTRPVFITTPDFLAEHLAQMGTTKDLIITAQAKGNTRLAEMNQRVATNLENIINTIQAPDRAEADDAS